MEKVGVSIDAITTSVTTVKTLIDQVSEASRQQAHGFGQVSNALAQMEQATQATASTAEESAHAGEALKGQAERSLRAVEQFESLVGADGAATNTAAPATPVLALRRAA